MSAALGTPSLIVAVTLAFPWIVAYIGTAVRATHSRSLDDAPIALPDPAPRVSIVIPARNEARNIASCARSALGADYPRLQVIVVDDHSTDDTGAVASALADEGALIVTTPPPLPDGWFGKQWACEHGARVADGDIIGFLDADTIQRSDLVPRVVSMMRARGSDLLTVAGTQELGSFWEKLLQPQVFAVMLSRFGGTESVNGSRRTQDKIANGQCLFVRRDAYVAMGGHGAVRGKVAEDLALAQLWFRAGRRTTLVLGVDQLSTRMYTSLRELADGWGKNIYAGGIDSMPGGAVGRLLYPLLLHVPWLTGVVPPIVLVLALAGVLSAPWLLWSGIVTAANTIWWFFVYRGLALSPMYVLLHPLGAAVMLYVSVRAVLRGRRVRWKEREYRSA